MNTATLGFRTPIATSIDAVARAGFGAVSPWRHEIDGKDVRTVSRQIRDAGLKVSGYCRSTYIPAIDRARFLEGIEDNRGAIDQAAALGAEFFVMVVGSLPTGSRDLPAAWAQVEEGLTLLLDYARSVGVRLALEPLHPMYANDRSCLNTLEQALDMADRIEPVDDLGPRLGIALDLYHVWWDPKLAAQIARAGDGGRLFTFHVCDWLVPTRDFLMDRGMMGDGVIDIPRIRRMVEEAGYGGAVEVEIFSERDWWCRPISETLAVCARRLQTCC